MELELIKKLEAQNYTDLKIIPTGQVCGLMKFAFTSGLMVELNRIDYERRYCYEFESDARAALRVWNGQGHPTGPWIKCKGRYKGRPIDLLNPKINQF